jgi:Putative prokaryotic signal transducing protein
VSDLVEAARFNTRVEADLARLYLESEGVDAVLFDTGINHFYGGLFLPVRLMVLADDAGLARRLLSEKAP